MSANSQDLVALAALAGPEAAVAVEGALEGEELVKDAWHDAKSFSLWMAKEMGLTAEDDYRGWLPLLELGYLWLYPPLKLAYQIELGTAAVMRQLYQWLGGDASAFDTLVKDVTGATGDLAKWIDSL